MRIEAIFQRTPWTSIRDVEMISVFLRRELSSGLAGDPIPKRRLSALEFSGLVIWIHPGSDLYVISGLSKVSIILLPSILRRAITTTNRHAAS